MLYQISYDLNKEKNYDKLYEGIKSYADYCKVLLSMWAISTNQTAQKVHDKLKLLIDNDDHIFISEINANRQGWVPDDAAKWFKTH
jgi:hypothetical protein